MKESVWIPLKEVICRYCEGDIQIMIGDNLITECKNCGRMDEVS